MTTTSWCVVRTIRQRLEQEPEKRPKPRRLDRQLPSKPMRIGLPSGLRADGSSSSDGVEMRVWRHHARSGRAGEPQQPVRASGGGSSGTTRGDRRRS